MRFAMIRSNSLLALSSMHNGLYAKGLSAGLLSFLRQLSTTLFRNWGSSISVTGVAHGRSLFLTILYGLPHGSRSSLETRSSQAAAFACIMAILKAFFSLSEDRGSRFDFNLHAPSFGARVRPSGGHGGLSEFGELRGSSVGATARHCSAAEHGNIVCLRPNLALALCLFLGSAVSLLLQPCGGEEANLKGFLVEFL